MPVRIDRAVFPDDIPALEELFGAYLEFLFERMPGDRAAVCSKYDPGRIVETVRGFARIHAGPGGEILIARLDGAPVGCGMMRGIEPGVVEVQRIFVSAAARGHGIGRALTLALIDRARADGQTAMRLDTCVAFDEAIGLYTKLGFRERAPYHAHSPGMAHLLRYFEMAL